MASLAHIELKVAVGWGGVLAEIVLIHMYWFSCAANPDILPPATKVHAPTHNYHKGTIELIVIEIC